MPTVTPSKTPIPARGTLDLDVVVTAHLIPSRTPGHHHLYLDAPMNWRSYKRLLKALSKAGIVDAAWAKACLQGHQTLLRPPGAAYPGANAELVFVCNPSHEDIHTRHVAVRREEREERDGYTTEHYTVLTPVTERAKVDYITSRVKTGGHAPALDIDIPASQSEVVATEDGLAGRSRLHFEVTMSPYRRKRLLKALTRCGIIEGP